MTKSRNFLINIGLLVAGIFLFALPHPNFISVQGFPLLSYFCYIPLFILIHRLSWKTVWAYGLIYGIGCYAVFAYWLAVFNPVCVPVISGMYGLYLMVAFLVLKGADSLFPKHNYFAQWVIWCAYEYVKTLGFSGFNYAVTAYSQWRWGVILQSASIFGVFGLSAVISFTSAWFTTVIKDSSPKLLQKILNHKVSACIWLVIFTGLIIYGFVSPVDYSENETRTVALIQTNSDPWYGGESAFSKDLKILKNLSDKALAENPDVDFVVWPETAFIPRITYNYQHRPDQMRYGLVKDLLEYIDSKDVPFVIGNDDCVQGYDADGNYGVLDYNAALLFRPGENVIPPEPEKYWKNHLVPFTEHFPFKKELPFIYNLLKENDTHFWESGTEKSTFNIDGVTFFTPICFEDTFGNLCREFVLDGAQLIVNMSNDAWARTAACQYQHLAMGLFRAVENRIPSVRSTSSGQTVIIDPNGKIIQMLEPFEENYLVGEFPVMDTSEKTLYTKYGDYAGVFFVVASIIMLAVGIILKILEKTRKCQK